MQKYYSIHELEWYGLSKTMIEKAEKLNIFSLLFQDQLFLRKYKITQNNFEKILSSIKEAALKDTKWEILLKTHEILNNNNKIDYDKFINYFEENEFNVSIVDYILNELINLNLYKMQNNFIVSNLDEININNYMDYLNFIKNNLDTNQYEMLFSYYIKNKTLNEIGIEKNITRERVRQILNKTLKIIYSEKFYLKLNCQNEVSNAFLLLIKTFCTYDVSLKLFLLLFPEKTEDEYYTLKLIEQLYSKEECKKDEIELISKIEDNEKKNFILENMKLFSNNTGEIEKIKTNKLILSAFENSEIILDVEEIKKFLLDKYKQVLDERLIIRICDDENPFLSLGGRKYKIFNGFDKLNYYIEEIKKVLLTKNGVYSFDYFVENDLYDICKEMSITSGNELHNFCKKNINDELIKYKRMPLVCININDELKFYKDLIASFEPIHINDFAKYLNKHYGHKINTTIANLPKLLDDFFDRGILKTNIPNIDEINLNIIKKFLSNDIIFSIKEIYDFFESNNIDVKYINQKTFNLVDFYLEKNIVINKKWTIKKILIEEINKNGYYILGSNSKISQDYNYLPKLQKELFIVRESVNKYNKFEKYECEYFNKNIVSSFLRDTDEYIPQNEFFSLNQIIENFKNKYDFVYKLDRDIIKYYMLLNENVYLCSEKFNLFSSKKITLDEMIINIINKLKSNISIYDLIKLINEKFIISIDKQYLLKIIKKDLKINYDENWETIIIN